MRTERPKNERSRTKPLKTELLTTKPLRTPAAYDPEDGTFLRFEKRLARKRATSLCTAVKPSNTTATCAGGQSHCDRDLI